MNPFTTITRALLAASLASLLGFGSAGAGVSAPPVSLTNIPSMGYALRQQGWNPIGVYSLYAGTPITVPSGLSGAIEGTTTLVTEVPSATVPRIRLVYTSMTSNATPYSELPIYNDIYIAGTVWDSTDTYKRRAFFRSDIYGTLRSRGVLISDDILWPTSAGTPFDVRDYYGVSGTGNVVPRGLNIINTHWVSSSHEGLIAEDATNFNNSLATSNSGVGYSHVAVLGYTGPGPVKSLWCAGDSLYVGTGDGSGPRPSYGGYCWRIGAQALAANVQSPSFTPAFGVGIGAESGDTLADIVANAGVVLQGRLPIASMFSTVMSDMGTNDIGGTLATVEANKLTEACDYALNGSWFIAATLVPETNSTDGFTTVVNQTVRSSEANRLAYNTWLRNAGSTGFSAEAQARCPAIPAGAGFSYFDADAAVEVNSSNVLTIGGGFWEAPVGETALYTGSVTSGGFSTGFTDSALTPTTVNSYRGDAVVFTSGSIAGGVSTVSTQITTAITFGGVSGQTPTTGNAYSIWAHVYTQDGTHPTSYGAAMIAAAFPLSLAH